MKKCAICHEPKPLLRQRTTCRDCETKITIKRRTDRQEKQKEENDMWSKALSRSFT